MEWDPWFEQGDWELEKKPLHSRKQKSKKFAKCRAAAKKLAGGLEQKPLREHDDLPYVVGLYLQIKFYYN